MSDPALVSKFSLLASALVLGSLCIIAIATTSGGNETPEAANAPNAAATLPLSATDTATPMSSPPPFFAPAATPEPGREGPEATLVEVGRSKTLPLWQPGTIVRDTVFSPDGRWLYFARFDRNKGACDASLYRIDLQADELLAQRITTGFGLAISGQGYVAFQRCASVNSPTLHILLPDGSIHDLLAAGASFLLRWSPDGRWLTYGSPYLGDGIAMPQTIVDTQTWQERTFAKTLPCNCDGGPVAVWSPDSTHFVYTTLIGRPPGETSMTSVYDAETLASSAAPVVSQWVGPEEYLGWSQQGTQTDYFVFNIETGTRRPVSRPGTISPDGSLLAVPVTGPSLDIVTLNGAAIASGLEGFQPQWSPDSAYVATMAQQSDCGAAVLTYTSDGRYVFCASLGDTGSRNAPAFSPDSKSLAYLKTRWLENPPRSSATPMTSDLYVIDLSSGTETKLTSDLRGFVGCVYWSADSRFLVAGACVGL